MAALQGEHWSGHPVDLGEAFRLADRIGVMKSGRLLQLAPPAELTERPADPYVQALLEAR